ncbi:hypothetical protein DPMN_023993 [Dreissena polymorpha]|uniref:Uncharacterized protein n=1 Tax=Dreissena polymorpha TaxID=45954 RepID=A0A9D4LLN7_DREPO|nr:hypothetical protein DPMN_023993 [Dreissena polymorpha]
MASDGWRERRTDGKTDRRMDRQRQNNIPPPMAEDTKDFETNYLTKSHEDFAINVASILQLLTKFESGHLIRTNQQTDRQTDNYPPICRRPALPFRGPALPF